MRLGYKFTILCVILGTLTLSIPYLFGNHIDCWIPTILFWGLALVYCMISMTSDKEKMWNEEKKK